MVSIFKGASHYALALCPRIVQIILKKQDIHRYMANIFPYFLLWVVAPLAFGITNSSGVFSIGIMNPLTMVFFRWLGVVLIMVPFLAVPLWQCRHAIIEHWRLFLVASTLAMIICPAAVYVGGQYTTAMNLSLLYSLAPIFTLSMERLFFGKRLSTINMAGVAMAFTGVIFIIAKGDWTVLLTLQFSVGDLWGLAGALSWGTYAILVRKQETILSGKQLFTLNAVLGTLMATPLMAYEIAVLGKPIVVTPEFFVIWGVLSIVSSIIAYMSMVYIIIRLSVTASTYPLYISPLYVVVIAIFFLGETLHVYHIISGIVILSGVFLALKKDKPRQDNIHQKL